MPVDVVDGTAERLEAADGSFELRFIEHVRADGRAAAGLQRAIDATVWPRLIGGCHTSRDVLATMATTGFHFEHVQRMPYAATAIPFPVHPHVTGVAVRPFGGGHA